MAANTLIFQTPKRFKKEDPQQSQPKQSQEDSEDFSFLDDIDVDLIAKCLNSCKDPANSNEQNEQNNANKCIARPATKHHHKLSIKKHVVIKDQNFYYLMEQLKKQLFHVYKENYYTSLIHNGKHSIIIKCKDVDDDAGKNVAVKILKEKTIYTGQAKQEMLSEVQKSIAKENLFTIFFNSGFSIDTRWCFVMDYYPVTLSEVMQPLHIYKVQALAVQLISAVEILHSNDIIHSDIKRSHILMNITNENLRLCGFDDAYYRGVGKNSANVGSLNYRAPEIILGYSYGFSIDVWSTAVVLAEMATGATLFRGHSNNDMLFKQMNTFGPIPNEMIVQSKYRAQYFSNNKFKRITPNGTKDIPMDIFHEPNVKLKKIMLEAQTYHWRDYDEKQTKRCKQKLYSFVDLLKQMMTIVPEDRSTICEAYEFFVKFIYSPVSQID